ITGLISDNSDLQNELDAKKDEFTENTAFNKNFGAVADTVCEGDDSRLTNIKDEIIFNDRTGNEPAHVPGQMYSANGGLNYHGDYPEVTLQVGQEQYIEVVNVSGATILNGQAVKYVGISNNVPAVNLAIANSFIDGKVIGIATMEIPDGSKGLITTFGSVAELDTSAFAAGDYLYLSESTPGGFVTVPPDILSYIGVVLISDITVGKIFTRINNLAVLPTIYGAMVTGSAANSFSANTYYPVVNYASGDDVTMPVDLTNGTIYVPSTGKYKFTANVVLNFNSIGNAKEDIFLGIFDEGDVLVHEIQDFLGKDSEAGSFYPSFLFDAVAGKSYHIALMCSVTLTNITYSLVSFDITSVHIR
ncbi:MAG: hypothetical protein DRQ42_08235, partial [Gammaproteobacteria bacterium]